MESTIAIKNSAPRRNRWFEGVMAIIALLNFALVCFDFSYIPWRDFYFEQIPSLTVLYDPIKGIEPHRQTQHYLSKVNELETQIQKIDLQTDKSALGVSPEVDNLLQELRNLSNEMVEENPFAIANKSGTLEKIKNQIRDRVGIRSIHKAFASFWSQEHLSQVGWQQELEFFNSQIRPLLQSNYYRGISTNGRFIDDFWKIDLPFVILFGIEFLIRTFYISRSQVHLNWLKAMLRRWYDILLLLPIGRWLRIIPVTIRLQQADLLNLEPIQEQINRDFVSNFAPGITEVVGVRIIAQMQQSIQRGDVTRWLFHPENRRRYIHVNDKNEISAIATRILNVSVQDVLPKVKPDIEALLHHAIENTINQSPVYQQFQNVPGFKNLPTQVTETLATNLSQSAYGTLANTLKDPVTAELTARLSKNFVKTLEVELQKQHNLQELQSLLVDLLEEIKINYVKGLAEEGVEKTLDEAEKLHYIAYKRKP